MKHLAVFGPPRSGTTWLSAIFNSHPKVILRFQPLFSYGHKGALTVNSSREEICSFFDEISISNDPFVLMQTEEQKKYPVFLKSDTPTHLVFKETRYLHILKNILEQYPDIKVIGIIRNPLATLASWVCAPKEFSQGWNFEEEWRNAEKKNQGKAEEYYGFSKWIEACESFLEFEHHFPNSFKLVRYEELNKSPMNESRDIFHFCELNFEKQTQEFITASRSRHDADPYSVFRGRANDQAWQEIIPEKISNQITNELKGTLLEQFL